MVCQQLGRTDRVIYNNAKGEALLTVWVHPHCQEFLKKPEQLEYEWNREPSYKPTFAYPTFTSVQTFRRVSHSKRLEKPWC